MFTSRNRKGQAMRSAQLMKRRLLAISLVLATAMPFGIRFGLREAKAQSSNKRPASPKSPESIDWPVYGGQLAADHYSPLTQINQSNVGNLKVAWTFDTG